MFSRIKQGIRPARKIAQDRHIQEPEPLRWWEKYRKIIPWSARTKPEAIGDTPAEIHQALKDRPKGISITPRRILNIEYGDHAQEVLDVARNYRREHYLNALRPGSPLRTLYENSGKTPSPEMFPWLGDDTRVRWQQSLLDRHLDKPATHYYSSPTYGNAAGFIRPAHREVHVTSDEDTGRIWDVIKHETLTHALQPLVAEDALPLKRNYVHGLEPTTKERFQALWYSVPSLTSRVGFPYRIYYLGPRETEAHLADLMRAERNRAIKETIAKGGGRDEIVKALTEISTPEHTRKVLEDFMYRYQRGGIQHMFRGLDPEQRERFLRYWSAALPGIVYNNPQQRTRNADTRYSV